MSKSRPLRRVDLVHLISPSLGETKAAELIVSTAAKLHLNTFEFSQTEAVQIFNELAKEGGLVAIASLLAKSRISRLIKQKVD